MSSRSGAGVAHGPRGRRLPVVQHAEDSGLRLGAGGDLDRGLHGPLRAPLGPPARRGGLRRRAAIADARRSGGRGEQQHCAIPRRPPHRRGSAARAALGNASALQDHRGVPHSEALARASLRGRPGADFRLPPWHHHPPLLHFRDCHPLCRGGPRRLRRNRRGAGRLSPRHQPRLRRARQPGAAGRARDTRARRGGVGREVPGARAARAARSASRRRRGVGARGAAEERVGTGGPPSLGVRLSGSFLFFGALAGGVVPAPCVLALFLCSRVPEARHPGH
mmetsp:Transcript_23289/g.73367  ORF Transcript_23289/g.73367 Transcript_23289/m.73367 type:complete len:279 (+) Transcript_23289:990-1826(+)